MNAVIVGFTLVAAGLLVKGMLTDEIRGWLNRFPGWLLRQAAKQLGPDRQEIYEELWLPDLKFILHEDRPITRLVKATRMAAGLLVSTRREARVYRCAAVEKTVTADTRVVLEGDPAQDPPVWVLDANPFPYTRPSRPGANGAAVPTMVSSDGGPSLAAQEYVRRTLEQMGGETRRRVFVDRFMGPTDRQ
jgi:hypothetical protein